MPVGIYKRSKEHRDKIGKQSKERWKSKAYRNNIIKKMGVGIKRLWQNEDYRNHMIEVHKGHKPSKKTKRKMSKSHLGKKAWSKGLTKETDERLLNLSNRYKKEFAEGRRIPWHKNKRGVYSKKTLKKLSKIKLGKKQTEETINKRKETVNRLFAEGKIKVWCAGLTKETDERLKKHSLLLRGRKASEETRKKMSLANIGKKHWNWLGGKSFEPYDIKFNKEFKNLVRLRDNFCCMNCKISEQKHIILTGRKLHIHHIDYDKKNTCLVNCITLCNKCNILANKNRNEWQNYYQDKLSKLCNYEYPQLNNIKIQ